jgi:hypothetical protein
MVQRRVLLALVLLPLLAVSLAAKIIRYDTHLDDGRDRAEAAITTALANQGFTSAGSIDLVTGGVVRALRFQAATCARPLLVVVLSGSAEGNDLLAQFMPADRYRMGFVYGGSESTQPPLVRYLTLETLRAVGRAIGLPVAGPQPFLGIASPLDCPVTPRWPALW